MTLKKNILLLVVALGLGITAAKAQVPDTTTIPAFRLAANSMMLSAPVQPATYFDKIGRRAALMGHEDGSFELWVWPWKPLRGFDLQFFLGSSTTPILNDQIARKIEVTPAMTQITYTYQTFTVKEIFMVPVEKRGAIVLLKVDNTVPLTIVPEFYPVLQPAWPAGIGGQYSYWDSQTNAYLLSESRQRATFLVGSPSGKQMSAPPAHMFASQPLQFKISVAPEQERNRYIPIVMAGGGNMKYKQVRSLYHDLWVHAAEYYRQNRTYYQHLQDSTVQIVTPDKKLNLAYKWGKVALHNLLVKNPNLGEGLVAGYDMSGGGGRPGFAWFFGGDAFINSLSLGSFQDFSTVKDALKFVQHYQRKLDYPITKGTLKERREEVGKIAHEISQSANGLVDWFNDYHYAYLHADTTPWYLVVMNDYYTETGDLAFIKEHWQSVMNAYDWCLRKDSDHDGLMDLKGAGLGSVEFGQYVNIYADAYTSAIWVKAIEAVQHMAAVLGKNKTEQITTRQLAKAKKELEKKFWLPGKGYYAYGATESGQKVPVKTPWPSIGLAFQVFNPVHSELALEKLNDADLCTDWGTRSLSPESKLYDPTNYNYGSAWPFLSSFFTTAQYRYHFSLAGYRGIQAVSRHVFEYGLGTVPEVFSGRYNQTLSQAVNDQGFSVSGYMLPLLRGLLGLKVDAGSRTLYFHPQLPANWDSLRIRNIKVGKSRVDLHLIRSNGHIRLQTKTSGPEPVTIDFEPTLGLGSRITSVTVNDRPATVKVVAAKQAYLPDMNYKTGNTSDLRMNLSDGPDLYLFPLKTQRGELNHSMKFMSQELSGNKLVISLDGRSGIRYQLGVRNPGRIASVSGATLKGNRLLIDFPRGETEIFNRYVKKNIVLQLR